MREPCEDWKCHAICRCGCQSQVLRRRFVPDMPKSLQAGKPVGVYAANWSAPPWLSIATQAIIDGIYSSSHDPAITLLREPSKQEWGGIPVSNEEFERLWSEEDDKRKKDLAQHRAESKAELLRYINEEGGMRCLLNAAGSPLGDLMAVALS